MEEPGRHCGGSRCGVKLGFPESCPLPQEMELSLCIINLDQNNRILPEISLIY